MSPFGLLNDDRDALREDMNLTSQTLQQNFTAALASIGAAEMPTDDVKRYTPILRRSPAVTREQALEHAAAALKALWSGRATSGNQ